MSAISQKQLQRQLQKLSPQQIQMIKLLELPSMQLEQRVKQEIEENPVLEEEPIEESETDEQKELTIDDYLKEESVPSYKARTNNYSKDDKQPQATVTDGRTLNEFLDEQLGYKQLDDRQLTIARFLTGSIDDDGYLRRDLQSVSDDLAFGLGMEVDVAELEKLLEVIHELEPTGVGARNLRECLLIQLDSYLSPTPSQQLARRIVANCFDEFSKKHYDKIMTRLSIDEDDFRDAIEEIRRLSPKPGNLFNEDNNDAAPYITPDFTLDYHNGEFELSLNSYRLPEIKINRRYVEMIRELASSDPDNQSAQEALRFVKSKIDSAKWFQSAIKQRHDTLMNTMREILNYQREYFVDGNRSKLRPMILKDIADRTSLDVSTISRVVNSKYIQTHFGIVPLKQLFSEAMQTDSGEEVSSYRIKQILQECIDTEDKRRPLTDEALMDILNQKGYHIARRTVAKYREMLGISVARLRRQL